MSILELIEELGRKDTSLSVEGDNIRITTSGNDVDDLLLKKVAERKTELIAFLKARPLAEGPQRIVPAGKKAYYPLSSIQKGMYVNYLLDPGAVSFNMFTSVSISHELPLELLESSFCQLVQRHEPWRTSFIEIDGIPCQQIHDRVDFSIEYFNDGLPAQQHIKDFVRPFQLEKAPLLRVGIVKQQENNLLLIDQHHIISDGASQQMLLNELIALLKGNELPPLSIQYKDFAAWQASEEYVALSKKQAFFWKKEFEKEIIPLSLPFDYLRPQVKSTEGASLKFILDEGRTKRLVKICQKENATLFTALFAIYHIFLNKLSRQQDLVIGLPSSGRNLKELEDVVGPFINTLAVRYCSRPALSFTDLLQEVKQKLLLARENQDYQYEELVAELAIDRDPSRNPLFDVALFLSDNNSRRNQLTTGDLPLRYYDHEVRVANYDLDLRVDYVNDKLTFHFDYSTRLFKKETITRFINYFEVLINAVLEFPGKKIGQLQILPEAEKQSLLDQFKNSYADFPVTPVADWFEERVMLHPHCLALVQHDQQLTYAFLHERSSRLAALLLKYGVGPNNLVCLVAGNSIDLVVGMFAIIKAGAACVPVDRSTPAERIRSIVNDCNAGIVLFEGDPIPGIPHCLQLNITSESNYSLSPDLKVSRNVNDAVYVIYNIHAIAPPAGVLINQYSLINFVHAQHTLLEISADVRGTQVSNSGFNVTGLEAWICLLGGGTLYIPGGEIEANAEALKKYLQQHAINFSFQPVHRGEQLLKLDWDNAARSLKHLVLGGNTLNYQIKQTYPFKIFYVYGHNEDTFLSAWVEVNQYASESEIIGVPFQNKKVYILNNDLSLMPVNSTGEVVFAGTGIARGYLNNPELTNERFVPNPYEHKSILYRTGDLGMWRSDGVIKLVDRKVDQLTESRNGDDEVSKALLRYPGMQEAFIVACYNSASAIDEPALIGFLRKELPAYMIPARFVNVSDHSLMANGNNDLKNLPALLPQRGPSHGQASPRNEMDKAIIRLWAEILKTDESRIGIHQNFFNIGGHSMKAIELCSHLHRVFNRKVKLDEIFKHPTVAALSDHLLKLKYNDYRVITKAVPRPYYEMSQAQKRIFFLSHFEEASIAYNMPFIWHANAPLNINKLENAIAALIRRHDILRTSFRMNDGRPVQVIGEDIKVDIETFTCRKEEVDGVIKKFFRPFNLLTPPLFRFAYIETTDGRFVLLSDKHHIISDGFSENLFFSELIKLYNDEALPPVQLQYKDFSEWQRSDDYKTLIAEQEKFWLSQFKGDVPVLDIITDEVYPAVRTYEGGAVNFYLEESERQRLYTLAADNNTTLFCVLLSAINILLAKLSAQEDIVVGTLTSGRNNIDLNEVLGIFINTLAIRNFPDGDKNCRQFIQEVKENVIRCFENQDYPFETLLERLSLSRDPARNPLFNAIFVLQNLDAIDNKPVDVNIDMQAVERSLALFDLSFQVIEKSDQLHFSIGFYARIFRKETIERFAAQLQEVIRSMVSDPGRLIGEIEILSSGEKNTLLNSFNNTETDLPAATLVAAFEKHAQDNPFRIAVSHAQDFCTYGQLDQMANRCANMLLAQFSERGGYVGILLNSGIDMMMGILATWKAGMAYIPLDTTHPDERISYILNNSGASLLITTRVLVSKKIDSEFSDRLVYIDDKETWYAYSNERPAIVPQLNDTAYVIYTSGSTGFPKGAMITHFGMMNHINAKIDLLQTGKDDIIAQTAVPTFDISVWQFFTALVTGAKTAIFSKELVTDPEEFIRQLQQQQVTILEVVPSYLALLTNYCQGKKHLFNSLKYLLVTGEELHGRLVKDWTRMFPALKIVNAYGPTEAADDVTHYVISGESDVHQYHKIPIGSPVRNTRLYVLDRHMKLCAPGVKGEICVSGAGLGKGYLNDEERTAKSFISNPFGEGLYGRLYRTGDLGYWRQDGLLVYSGRIDHQIKIRGNRVELEEIEQKLMLHPSIREAVVAIAEKENDKYLYACYTSDEPVDDMSLSNHLSLYLPAYMVPANFLRVEQFPLLASGKINRKQLPVPEISAQREIVKPRNPIDEAMVLLWAELLKTEPALISINDNFFVAGGHSLKAMELIGRIRERFNRHISLSDIFRLQTLHQIADFLIPSTDAKFQEIVPAVPNEYYALSSAQKRLFVVDQFINARTGYNLSGVVYAGDDLDEEKVEQVFRELIARHEILRTSFELVDQRPRQRVHASIDFYIEKYQAETDEQVSAVINSFIRPFDLSAPPLIRAGLIHSKANGYLLMYDMHHMVSDGVSMNIIWKEFISLYKGEVLPPLQIQYKDYAEWQQARVNDSLVLKQETYWVNRLKGELPILNLPVDLARPKQFTYAGSTCGITLDPQQSDALKQLCKRTGTTMYTMAMAILNVVLYKYTGAEDLLVGAALSGREHPALQNMLGVFVNTLVIRNAPAGNKRFDLFLQEINQSLQEAYDNMDYQFDDLVEKLNPERDMSRNPLIDICLSSQNFGEWRQGFANDGKDKAFSIDNHKAKLDLTLYLHENETNVLLVAEYYAAVFKRGTIERILQHFVNIAEKVTTDPTVTLARIEMLSTAETKELLYDFNNSDHYFGPDTTFHGIVENQVEKTPTAIAVEHADRQLTYRQLDSTANRIGNFLFGQPYLQKGDLVGLLINDPVLQVAAMLGVLKAGLAFVPIDNEFPEERIATIIIDGNIKAVLTDDKSLPVACTVQAQTESLQALVCLNIDDVHSILRNQDLPVAEGKLQLGSGYIEQQTDDPVPVKVTGDDVAYVIYTSGSSGTPKGVVIAHKGIANSLMWRKEEIGLNAADRVLQVFSYVFDGFLTSTFAPLIAGATVILMSRDESRELSLIRKSIIENSITHFICVPSFFELIIDFITEEEAQSVRSVALAGEKIRKGLVTKSLNKWRRLKIINEYGPTENSVCATFSKWVTEETSTLIGRPISNVKAYILNKDDQLCPVGVVGELCLSGTNLSKGYLHLPGLTAKHFTSLPFNNDERMYRTGDLARWLPDGNLEYFYRADDQVKIRGYRIELEEIERVIKEIEAVAESIVIYTKNAEELHGSLVAYYTGVAEVNTIREKLKLRLPEYFMPGHIIQLDKLPRLMSGKIDKKALPAPLITGSDVTTAGDAIEEKIRRVWSEVLYCDEAGINLDDDFFDIGGHSLVAIELIVKIKDAFGCTLELADIFDHSTIRELARLVKNAQPETDVSILTAPVAAYYPLSYAQKRIFIQHYLENGGISFNMPAFFELPAGTDKEQIRQILLQLVERHEILRTAFVINNGATCQVVHDTPAAFELEYIEVAGDPTPVCSAFVRPFDLGKSPLFRAVLCKTTEQRFILGIDLHHIIADGISVMLLMKEFLQLYKGEELPRLKITYKDFAVWQTGNSARELLHKQELYWVERISRYTVPIQLPADYLLPSQQSFATGSIVFTVAETISDSIRKLCNSASVTPFMVVLSAYALALYDNCRQSGFVVGVPVSGRNNPDLEQVIGMFMNTLAFPVNIDESETGDAFLKKVKGDLVSAFDNQDYPLQLLVEKLQVRPDPYRNPLFDVMLTFNNFETKQAALNEAGSNLITQSAVEQQLSATSKYYLSLECFDNGKTISGQLVYRTELFKSATIALFIENFLAILQSMTVHTSMTLQGLLQKSKEGMGAVSNHNDDLGFNF